ncbi:MAG TPA: copper homeostasis periplasmic binding protein CopC [Phenylobacterium sp.]|nr:copper homeostasis periplasmic binding protein CopC [Phenylobacterium sp.]
MFRTSLAIALVAALGASTSALAHPKMVAANPPANGRVTASPQAIRITFSEAVFANFSGLVVKDHAGHVMKTGRPTVDPADKTVLVAPFARPLAAGVYHVEWHAVAADTHRVTGQFMFTIG